MKRMLLCVLLLLSTSVPILSNSLTWDSGRGVGELENLNMASADTNTSTSYYSTGEHYGLPGFLGRFVYQGTAGNTLSFVNSGPVATGGSASPNSFYFTKTNDTSRWRKVFFVATAKGLTHGESGLRILPNVIIDSNGDTLTLPAGAGTEQVDPFAAGYSGGYDANGVLGSGPSFIYLYPYRLIWIDITVIRTGTTSGNLGNTASRGGYVSQLLIQGSGLSMGLTLAGYIQNTGSQPDSYAFELERVCPDIIPFDELVIKNSYLDSYKVGNVRFYSVDTPASVYFASDAAGTATDFRFVSPRGSFAYYVLYDAITPAANAVSVSSVASRFSSTSSPVTFTSPLYSNETELRYILNGEVRIFVFSDLQNLPLPADSYSSKIYVFLVTQ